MRQGLRLPRLTSNSMQIVLTVEPLPLILQRSYYSLSHCHQFICFDFKEERLGNFGGKQSCDCSGQRGVLTGGGFEVRAIVISTLALIAHQLNICAQSTELLKLQFLISKIRIVTVASTKGINTIKNEVTRSSHQFTMDSLLVYPPYAHTILFLSA